MKKTDAITRKRTPFDLSKHKKELDLSKLEWKSVRAKDQADLDLHNEAMRLAVDYD